MPMGIFHEVQTNIRVHGHLMQDAHEHHAQIYDAQIYGWYIIYE